nr:Sulfur carrier protein ThiS adenylyltransferase [Cupriavidus sp.]
MVEPGQVRVEGSQASGLDPDQLSQFSRLLLLPDFDEVNLLSLCQKRVLIVGVGGLGAPVALYLAQAGLRAMRLIDPDTVSLTNLPRQVLFSPEDLGRHKAEVVAQTLRQLAPRLQVEAHIEYATSENLSPWVAGADLVLDCTDQFSVRQEINRSCIRLGKPLVSASALQWSGQLLVVDPNQPEAGCYACLFDPGNPPKEAACGAYGVFSTAVGTMGLLQANEALKILLGKKPSAGALRVFDAKEPRLETLRFSARPGCPVCQSRHPVG